MIAKRQLVILGSTGSIGRNALEVLPDLPDIQVCGLSGCRQLELLAAQGERFPDAALVAADVAEAAKYPVAESVRTRWTVGPDRLCELAAAPGVDLVLAAIVGCAGLNSTHAAIAAGKTVALANKEALVVAGELLIRLAAETGAQLIPVDSEHSAVWQASQAGRREEIDRVILTASGGPFRDWSAGQLSEVTPAAALAHPTWEMGPKITVDSATLMNKALEIVEASWLFDLRPEQIQVMIHPQSIVHSLVEFCDGSVMAQLSPPDMRLPIHYALSYPQRKPSRARRLDWQSRIDLELRPPEGRQNEALELGYEVVRRRGTAGAVLNAANEAAVAAFLQGQLPFDKIVPACRRILDQHQYLSRPTMEQLMAADRRAREELYEWIGC